MVDWVIGAMPIRERIRAMLLPCMLGIAVIGVLSMTSGCALSSKHGAQKLSEVAPQDPTLVVQTIKVSREKLRAATERVAEIQRARIVEVYHRNQEYMAQPPEYRLFELPNSSAWEMLGLRNGDVILAANDYLIPEPAILREYVRLLPGEPKAFIDLRRISTAGKNGVRRIRIEYEFE